MTEKVDHVCIRGRLKELNNKAYYLLIALSLIYRSTTEGTWMLKLALTFTAIVAVLPVQDYVNSACVLQGIRFFKVAFLIASLVFMLVWLW